MLIFVTLNFPFLRDEDAPMMIEDESAQKPSGWMDDEAELIPDPVAVRPADWQVSHLSILMKLCTSFIIFFHFLT